jgi:hypothetical protein
MSPAAALPVVGVPRETKPGEHRVALTPDGVAELVAHGVEVVVERDAGADSAITDVEYRAAGAAMVIKVKGPSPRSSSTCVRAWSCSPTSTSPRTRGSPRCCAPGRWSGSRTRLCRRPMDRCHSSHR